MTREQAKKLLPIIQAFAEGNTIEARTNSINKWIETTTPTFDSLHEYRIKPKSKYRPFKNEEECLKEMLKHQPFGWLKTFYGLSLITEIRDTKAAFNTNDWLDFNYIFRNYKFMDNAPFGIKE